MLKTGFRLLLLLSTTICLAEPTDGPSADTPLDAPGSFSLVLSGGGARGLAQIGVLQALDKAGLKPGLIVATSMGAIIGGLYAAGYSTDTIAALARESDWESLFENEAERKNKWVSQKAEPADFLFEVRFDSDLTPVLPNAVSHGQTVYSALAPLLAAPLFRASLDFDSLPTPLRIISTDLTTGKSVVFSHGDLTRAIRASSGIPLAFTPVEQDSMLLLDGGLTANIPCTFASNERPWPIIAVDVTSPMMGAAELNNPINFVNQIVAIGIERTKNEERALADILIRPNLDGFVYTNFDDVDTLIERGYRAATEALPAIKRLTAARSPRTMTVDHVDLPSQWRTRKPIRREWLDSTALALAGEADSVRTDSLLAGIVDMCAARGYPFAQAALDTAGNNAAVRVEPGIVKKIAIKGNNKTSRNLILSATDIKPGDALRQSMIRRTISFLYATGLFHTVNIHVDSGMIVHIVVTEKEYWRTRVGLRFDDFHLGEGYVQPAYENLFGWGVCALFHFQYGLRREKYSFELQGSSLFSARLANDLRMQFYISREKISKFRRYPAPDDTTGTEIIEDYAQLTLRKAGILASAGTQIGRMALLSAGARIERFRETSSDRGQFEDAFGLEGGLLGGYRLGMRYIFLRLIIDDLDKYPFPRNGQKHYITVGGASDAIGGTENFVKIDGSLEYYRTFAKRHTLSAAMRMSWADTRLPAVERVFLGGSFPEEKYRDLSVYHLISFAGLPPLALPGDLLGLLHMRYRFALQKRFYLIAQADWGNTWDYAEERGDPDYAAEMLDESPIGIGLGLSYDSRFGPLSVSWGRLLREGKRLRDKAGLSAQNIIYFSAGYDF